MKFFLLSVSLSRNVILGSWKFKMMLKSFIYETLDLPLLEKLASLAGKPL